ncbi:MAG: hypothetical protein J7L54_05500 [Elusimicrobia bacterium]|nr:hypothetical protein [Elusimicrobiota bacterium]
MRVIGELIFSDGKNRSRDKIVLNEKGLSVSLKNMKKLISSYDGFENIIGEIIMDIALEMKKELGRTVIVNDSSIEVKGFSNKRNFYRKFNRDFYFFSIVIGPKRRR